MSDNMVFWNASSMDQSVERLSELENEGQELDDNSKKEKKISQEDKGESCKTLEIWRKKKILFENRRKARILSERHIKYFQNIKN